MVYIVKSANTNTRSESAKSSKGSRSTQAEPDSSQPLRAVVWPSRDRDAPGRNGKDGANYCARQHNGYVERLQGEVNQQHPRRREREHGPEEPAGGHREAGQLPLEAVHPVRTRWELVMFTLTTGFELAL